MTVRNITAAIACMALIVFAISCGCSSSKLSLNITDDAIVVSASNQVTSMTMTTFSLEEDEVVHLESDLDEGNMSVTMSSTYGGEILFDENFSSHDTMEIPLASGKYTLNITANKAVGTLNITNQKPKADEYE